MRKAILQIWATITLLFMAGASQVMGGLYVKQQVQVDPVKYEGQIRPATSYFREIWLDADKMASYDHDQQMTIVLSLASKKVLFIKHQEKSCFSAPIPLAQLPEIENMMNAFRLDVLVDKTGSRQQILGHDCDEYLVKLSGFMQMEIKMWCTSGLKLDRDNYFQLAGEIASLTPGLKPMLEKLKAAGGGFPLKQEMHGTVMGVETRTIVTAIEVKEGTISPERFEVPADYATKPLDLEALLGGGK